MFAGHTGVEASIAYICSYIIIGNYAVTKISESVELTF